jgi:hypothetical protein
LTGRSYGQKTHLAFLASLPQTVPTGPNTTNVESSY